MNGLIRFSAILFFLLGLSIITHAQSDQATYRYHICPNTTTFTKNSTYQANLNLLLSALSSNSTRQIGFYNVSAGEDPDDVYGLFLCRGDLSIDGCRSCVNFATQDVVQRCPIEKVAIIWYDQCLLRYSNESFFSNVDTFPSVYLWNTQNITEDQGSFNTLLGNMMRNAITDAARAPSGDKKFAVKEANVSPFQNLYSLVQCTPNLLPSDCRRCLEEAITRLPSCCNGKQGGRVLFPSCNIRYESYPFYNSTAIEAPPPSPGPSVPPPSRPPSPPPQSTGLICAICFLLKRLMTRGQCLDIFFSR